MAKKKGGTKKAKGDGLDFNFGFNALKAKKPRKKTGIRYGKDGRAYGS